MGLRTPHVGKLGNGLPVVRFGLGDQPLIILPGLGDALQPVTSMPRYSAWSFRRFAKAHSVYLVSRRRGLPAGYSTKDMAADYAAAIDNIGRPAHVLGLSLGSAIAQHLAADFPGHVHRLILSFAGCNGTPNTVASIRHLLELAWHNHWRAVYMSTVETTYSVFRPPLWRPLVPPFTRRPENPTDFTISAEACVSHDSGDRLVEITAPTLVVGGKEDRLVPQSSYHSLAGKIPGASLKLIEGSGYELYGRDRLDFETILLNFLQA
jgi:pimeloyl-ACP methyl ester carboxylesterase